MAGYQGEVDREHAVMNVEIGTTNTAGLLYIALSTVDGWTE